jgi:thiol-disulfide isomerase/thioredoxin
MIRSLCLAIAAALLLAASPVADAKVGEGDRAAELPPVVTQKGKKLRLRELRDKVVVLTFGASWCAPCKKELPALEKLARKYAGKNVVFIAVNIDEERKKGEKFMREVGLRAVIQAFDTRKGAVNAYDPPTMPTTYVVRKGLVRHVHKGYRGGDDRKLERVIAAELKKL